MNVTEAAATQDRDCAQSRADSLLAPSPGGRGRTPELLTPELLTPGEVGVVFRVDSKTVSRWAKAGKLHPIRTIGGHRRFLKAEVMYQLNPSDENRRQLMDDAAVLHLRLDPVALDRIAGRSPS